MASTVPAEHDLRRVIGDGGTVPDGEVDGLGEQELLDLYRSMVLLRTYDERSVVYHHAFRNALVPVITVVGLTVALLLSGAVLTETTFNWPGIGKTLITYLQNRDYAAVQGIIVVFALVVVVASLIIDFVNAYIDPRIRY